MKTMHMKRSFRNMHFLRFIAVAWLWAACAHTQIPSFLTNITNYKFCGDLSFTSKNDGTYNLISSGKPNHPTWQTNPNRAKTQDFSFTIPSTPIYSDNPYCLGEGPIAVAINGIPFFNLQSAECKNAVEGCYAETFDGCGGHADQQGCYHYHMKPNMQCIMSGDDVIPDNPTLIGIARDGHPIYIEKGIYYDRGSLDECNGKNTAFGYRYFLTEEFPYTLGCYRGEPSRQARSSQKCEGMVSGQVCVCDNRRACGGVYLFSSTGDGMSGCKDNPKCTGTLSEAMTECVGDAQLPTTPLSIYNANCKTSYDCKQDCNNKRRR